MTSEQKSQTNNNARNASKVMDIDHILISCSSRTLIMTEKRYPYKVSLTKALILAHWWEEWVDCAYTIGGRGTHPF
uniref:Uncharacterized protein n=1 Tax=Rhizophora mucronata TaxID=61149 RepID=A0A2P2PLN8_RHIMU